MTANKLMLLGSVAGFCLSIVALLVSDMHGIGIFAVPQNLLCELTRGDLMAH